MDPLILVPLLLGSTTLITSYIAPRFTSYPLLDLPKQYEVLARVSSLPLQIYLFYNGFYLTSEDAIYHFNRVTAGYMIYDLAHMITFQKAWSIYLHHIIYLVMYYNLSYIPQEYHQKGTSLAWLLESTSPFLTLCWFLTTFKYPMNRIHKSVRIVSFIYWSTVRIFIFPYLIYTWNNPVFYLGGGPFFCLQVYWFWLLVKKII